MFNVIIVEVGLIVVKKLGNGLFCVVIWVFVCVICWIVVSFVKFICYCYFLIVLLGYCVYVCRLCVCFCEWLDIFIVIIVYYIERMGFLFI